MPSRQPAPSARPAALQREHEHDECALDTLTVGLHARGLSPFGAQPLRDPHQLVAGEARPGRRNAILPSGRSGSSGGTDRQRRTSLGVALLRDPPLRPKLGQA
jgi:hypothetical protein